MCVVCLRFVCVCGVCCSVSVVSLGCVCVVCVGCVCGVGVFCVCGC